MTSRAVTWIAVAAIALALQGCAHFVVLSDPLSAAEHNDLGVAYESSGQLTLAKAEYRKSLRLDRHQVLTWVNLGNVEAGEGHWGEAEKAFRHALRESPDDADAMNNLAVALWHQRRDLDEARALARRAVAAGGSRDSVYRSTLEDLTREAP